MSRADLPEVRNPVLSLPATARLAELPEASREVLADILADLARDARRRADRSWHQNKGPMAAYWKAVGAHAGHLRRAVRSTLRRAA